MPRLALVGTLCALTLSACGDATREESPPLGAMGQMEVSAALGEPAIDVDRVVLSVSAADIPTPITRDLIREGDAWRGRVDSIPAGADRTVVADAYGGGRLLYTGRTDDVAIVVGERASVSLVLQRLNVDDGFSNAFPRIEWMLASAGAVGPGETISLRAYASDPDGDELIYEWSADGGAFDRTDGPAVEWSSEEEGSFTLRLTITDPLKASVYLEREVTVGAEHVHEGPDVIRNVAPVVRSIGAYPSSLAPGEAAQIVVDAFDSDLDELVYGFSAAGCTGTFEDEQAPDPFFHLAGAPPAGKPCRIEVIVTDGRRGMATASVELEVQP